MPTSALIASAGRPTACQRIPAAGLKENAWEVSYTIHNPPQTGSFKNLRGAISARWQHEPRIKSKIILIFHKKTNEKPNESSFSSWTGTASWGWWLPIYLGLGSEPDTLWNPLLHSLHLEADAKVQHFPRILCKDAKYFLTTLPSAAFVIFFQGWVFAFLQRHPRLQLGHIFPQH